MTTYETVGLDSNSRILTLRSGIADTLQSAIAQTWPRKEIIVVDDGSRDRTAEVARRFASKEVTGRVRRKRRSCSGSQSCVSSLARVYTSNGWTRMIFWRRTRSSASLLLSKERKTRKYCCRLRGPISITVPILHASSRHRCGMTFLQSRGS